MDDRRTKERLRGVIDEILEERAYQQQRWSAEHDAGHSQEGWTIILLTWLGKAASETAFLNPSNGEKSKPFKKRLVQLAAICVAALESLDA